MNEEEKDILIEEITEVAGESCNEGFNYATAERLATKLVERLIKKFNIEFISDCDCVIPKPLDPYDNIDKHICRDCNGNINQETI